MKGTDPEKLGEASLATLQADNVNMERGNDPAYSSLVASNQAWHTFSRCSSHLSST